MPFLPPFGAPPVDDVERGSRSLWLRRGGRVAPAGSTALRTTDRSVSTSPVDHAAAPSVMNHQVNGLAGRFGRPQGPRFSGGQRVGRARACVRNGGAAGGRGGGPGPRAG